MWQVALGLAKWARGKYFCETKEGKLSAAVRCLQLVSQATPAASDPVGHVPECVVKEVEKVLDRNPCLSKFFVPRFKRTVGRKWNLLYSYDREGLKQFIL